MKAEKLDNQEKLDDVETQHKICVEFHRTRHNPELLDNSETFHDPKISSNLEQRDNVENTGKFEKSELTCPVMKATHCSCCLPVFAKSLLGV